MKWFIRVIIVGCFLGMMLSSLFAQEVRVATDYWNNAVNEDNTGAYYEILNEVFSKNNVKYQFVIKPYEECKKLFDSQKVDAFIGAYLDEITQNVVYPKWHIDVDIVQVVFLKGKFIWHGEKTITKKNVVWQKGFDMDLSTSVPIVKFEANHLEEAFNLLKSGKCDFLLEEKAEIDGFFKKTPSIKSQDFEILTFRKKKLFLVFTPEAGKKYADFWDKEIYEMLRDGRLKNIFRKYGFLMPNQSITSYYYDLAK